MKTLGTLAIVGLLLACLAWETEQLRGFREQFRMDRARILRESRLPLEPRESPAESRTNRSIRPAIPLHPAVAWYREHLAFFPVIDLDWNRYWKEAVLTAIVGWIVSRAMNSAGPAESR